MLDYKFGSEAKTDIKALSLEGMEKREEKWFDAKRDLSEADIVAMESSLDDYRSARNWPLVAMQIENMLILGVGANTEISERDRLGMQLKLDQYREDADPRGWLGWRKFIDLAGYMRGLGIVFDLSSDDEAQIKAAITRIPTGNSRILSIPFGAYRLGLMDKVSEAEKDKVLAYIDALLRLSGFMDASNSAAKARLIGIEPRLSTQVHEKMKTHLRLLHQEGAPGEFARMAANLQILAAGEAKITPDGKIQLSDKSKPKIGQVTPLLPDQRNF